jgi:hypothetical protein
MAAGAIGLGAATVNATPALPAPNQPAQPVPPSGPSTGSPPSWAPPKPVDPLWANGQQQVWDNGWNHWGIWMNGVFVPTY